MDEGDHTDYYSEQLSEANKQHSHPIERYTSYTRLRGDDQA